MQALPAAGGTTLSAFIARTVQQHSDHLTAFNAAAVRLGGKAQLQPDAALMSSLVRPTLATLTTPAEFLTFAARLELVAAETYAAQATDAVDAQLRSTLARIMGVEMQHRAVLLLAATLFEAAEPHLFSIPVEVTQLPATTGSAGAPEAFLRTDQARPATEGAVR
jgi:hypothetical protein